MLVVCDIRFLTLREQSMYDEIYESYMSGVKEYTDYIMQNSSLIQKKFAERTDLIPFSDFSLAFRQCLWLTAKACIRDDRQMEEMRLDSRFAAINVVKEPLDVVIRVRSVKKGMRIHFAVDITPEFEKYYNSETWRQKGSLLFFKNRKVGFNFVNSENKKMCPIHNAPLVLMCPDCIDNTREHKHEAISVEKETPQQKKEMPELEDGEEWKWGQ